MRPIKNTGLKATNVSVQLDRIAKGKANIKITFDILNILKGP